ncbi:hypothetical protein HDR70_05110 [bacterium]|nr:hypothetical protein [bacterium]
MTPNPDSPSFITHDIPDNASETALKLRDSYRMLKANILASTWSYISIDDIELTYNIYDGRVLISIMFTDSNNHTHTFTITSFGEGKAVCEYLFEGSLNADAVSFRSYAEWLMLQLWQFEIGVELCNCDRGLSVSVSPEKVYDIISKMLDIVTNNIKPIEWFISEEPVWQFNRTYYDLQKMLPLLQEEAAKERWKDVKPENFRLIRNADCALISLDYTDNGTYTMQFRVGMKKGGFAAERTDMFMDMFYHFENHAHNEEIYKYFEEQNREFSEIANIVLDIPFKWKALLFHSEDGVYINTYREYAFQKYCLMLDCIIPLKDQYEATKPFISSELLSRKKDLEIALSTELEISEEQESTYIFTHGHFIETPIEEELSDECPF